MRSLGGVALSLALTLGMTLATTPATATPDGSPWGYSGGGEPDCTLCHFEDDAVAGSGALTLSGIDGAIIAGETYRLTLSFAVDDMAIAGFQMRAETDDGAVAGAFEALDGAVEANGAAIRSRIAGATPTGGVATWTFNWRASTDLDAPVRFFVAANAGNDDMSPFGDVVHLQEFLIKN